MEQGSIELLVEYFWYSDLPSWKVALAAVSVKLSKEIVPCLHATAQTAPSRQRVLD